MNGSIFGSFKSERPLVDLLPIGENAVEVVRAYGTDSATNSDGSIKASDKPYKDSCPQYAFVIKNINGKGVMTVRFQGMGYFRTEDFDAAGIEENKIVDGDGYAMVETEDGFVRLQHEGRTNDCKNILNQFMAALGLPEGSGLDAIVPGLQCKAIVEQEEYQGKMQTRVKSWRRLAVHEEAEADLK